MNRDESLTRQMGLPPAKIKLNGCDVLCPSESGGGTWIAANQGRVCFALINWYSVRTHVRGTAATRGKIILAVGDANSPDEADKLLMKCPLEKTNPFRLIGIFPATTKIIEWRWDLHMLARKRHCWRMQQWISSGFDEPVAQRVRSHTFRQALKQKSVGSPGWLRRLHRSHLPDPGPFSICMHRADATTVSYTEIVANARGVTMNYHAGSPCCSAER